MKPTVEVEIKLRAGSIEEALERLRRIAARPAHSPGTVYEQNALFDTPDHGLAARGSILRIRIETTAKGPGASRRSLSAQAHAHRPCLLTFKSLRAGENRPKPGTHQSMYKIREEIEFRMPDAARLERLFRRIGLEPWFRYEKFRTRFRSRRFPNLEVDLDETPIGIFLELEGPARQIDAAAKALGYRRGDYISTSYLELFREFCLVRGQSAHEMLFPAKKMR